MIWIIYHRGITVLLVIYGKILHLQIYFGINSHQDML